MGNKTSKGGGRTGSEGDSGSNRGSRNNEDSDLSGDLEKAGYYQQAKLVYNEMVNAIIRPPRAEYTVDMLGPREFVMNHIKFARTDLVLVNERKHKLECSHWCPVNDTQEKRPCMVYLHGNASCRAEALECLPLVLSSGLTLFSLDLSGSGQSDGEYISLGWYEREDVKVIVQHLRDSGKVSTIGLWGRSMGAVTALLHGDRDPSIACLVLDSPFASLQQLAKELVDTAQMNIPKFLVSMAIRWIRSSVKSRAKFDINKLEPIKHADRCFIPALFAAAEGDEFIQPHHSRNIYDIYAGDKNLVTFDGDHNTARPEFFLSSVGIFLHNTMVAPFEQELGHALTENPPAQAFDDAAGFGQVPHFNMPAPLHPGGAGIGIQVGTDGVEAVGAGGYNVNENDYYEVSAAVEAVKQN